MITVGHKVISDDSPPFMVAELSGNHNGSLTTALALVDAAHQAGADAFKVQSFTADEMTINSPRSEFLNLNPYTQHLGKTLYELYSNICTPYEWHAIIKQRCEAKGMIFFGTAFDIESANFLDSIQSPCFKISSYELVHIELLKAVALLNKPVIISTGMASIEDIDFAIATLRENGCHTIVLLKCTSSYPARSSDANLPDIARLKQRYNLHVGLSDHTSGIGVAIAAVALGAVIIEKHLCLSRADGGVDSSFSLEPHEFEMMVKECRRSWNAVNPSQSTLTFRPDEKERAFRRSLYYVKSVDKDEMLTKENLRAIRPGLGVSPRHLVDLIGARSLREITGAGPVLLDDLPVVAPKHQGRICHTKQNVSVIECDNCGFKHISPLPSTEDITEFYSQHYFQTDKKDFAQYFEEDREWLHLQYGNYYQLLSEHLIGGEKRILEIGCGTGFFLQIGLDLGWNVLGFEPSKAAYDYAADKFSNVPIINCAFDIDQLRNHQAFDVIFMETVLEHLRNPIDVLRKIKTVLRPGGLLCIISPNDYNPFQNHLVEHHSCEPWWVVPNHHINYFSLSSLTALLDRLNLTVIDQLASFPMELFILAGNNYLNDSKRGRSCHKLVKEVEMSFYRHNSELINRIYRNFAQAEIGRRFTIIARNM